MGSGIFTRLGTAQEDRRVSKIRIPNIEHLLRPRGAPAKISREAIAYHEAGHVLVCYHYSRDVLRATVAEQDVTREPSHVHFEPNHALASLMRRPGNPGRLWPEALEQTLSTVRILFGGPAAQALYQGVAFNEIDGGYDYQLAIRSLLALERLRLEYEELADVDLSHKEASTLDALAADANRVIQSADNQLYLDRIALRLLVHNSLDGAEINDLLTGMKRHDRMRDVHRKLVERRRPVRDEH
jgi:hypothetical protein